MGTADRGESPGETMVEVETMSAEAPEGLGKHLSETGARDLGPLHVGLSGII